MKGYRFFCTWAEFCSCFNVLNLKPASQLYICSETSELSWMDAEVCRYYIIWGDCIPSCRWKVRFFLSVQPVIVWVFWIPPVYQKRDWFTLPAHTFWEIMYPGESEWLDIDRWNSKVHLFCIKTYHHRFNFRNIPDSAWQRKRWNFPCFWWIYIWNISFL